MSRNIVNVRISATHYFLQRDQNGRPFGTASMVDAHIYAGNSIIAQVPVRLTFGVFSTPISRVAPTDEQISYWAGRGYAYTGTRYEVEPDANWLFPAYWIDFTAYQYYDEVVPPGRRLAVITRFRGNCRGCSNKGVLKKNDAIK